jgi:hypothetical protein
MWGWGRGLGELDPPGEAAGADGGFEKLGWKSSRLLMGQEHRIVYFQFSTL